MKKVCFFAAALLGSVLFLTVYQNAERSQILTQIKIPSYQLMMLPERAQEQVKKQYQELVAQVVPETFKMDQEAFKEHLEQLAVWEELKQELSLTESVQGAEEFVKALFLQVRAYQGIRIAWYHILFIVVVSILAFQIPELFLVAEQWKSKEKRMSECLRLQTVVLLLIHYEKTTVEEILSQMENFAVLFQSQMAEAVDHFSYDRIRPLQKLKQEIPDEPVQRICDALEFCEELPVEEAFLNLEDCLLYTSPRRKITMRFMRRQPFRRSRVCYLWEATSAAGIQGETKVSLNGSHNISKRPDLQKKEIIWFSSHLIK